MAEPGVLEDWLQKWVREPTLKYESLQLKSENHLGSPHRKRSTVWTYWIFKIARLSSIMLFANHLVCQSLFLLILQRFQRVNWKIKLYMKLRKADSGLIFIYQHPSCFFFHFPNSYSKPWRLITVLEFSWPTV